MTENGSPLDRAESRMAKADAAIDARALDRLAADAGIEAGPNRDAALGLPLVMTGSDSTRTLDNLTKWGVHLHGPDEDGRHEWRTNDGKWFLGYTGDESQQWTRNEPATKTCCYSLKQATENPPTIPPPDWTPHDGTKPGPTTPSRTDAASLSGLQARQRACRVVEQAAHQALLESLTTQEQFTLVRAYNDSIYATRKAELDVHFGLWAKGGAA